MNMAMCSVALLLVAGRASALNTTLDANCSCAEFCAGTCAATNAVQSRAGHQLP
jgi:hypothetical protein